MYWKIVGIDRSTGVGSGLGKEEDLSGCTERCIFSVQELRAPGPVHGTGTSGTAIPMGWLATSHGPYGKE